MIELTPGTTYVLEPADHLLRLIQQYDYFTITYGAESFLQIRVPTKWVRLEKGLNGLIILLAATSASGMVICSKSTAISSFSRLAIMWII